MTAVLAETTTEALISAQPLANRGRRPYPNSGQQMRIEPREDARPHAQGVERQLGVRPSPSSGRVQRERARGTEA